MVPYRLFCNLPLMFVYLVAGVGGGGGGGTLQADRKTDWYISTDKYTYISFASRLHTKCNIDAKQIQ